MHDDNTKAERIGLFGLAAEARFYLWCICGYDHRALWSLQGLQLHAGGLGESRSFAIERTMMDSRLPTTRGSRKKCRTTPAWEEKRSMSPPLSAGQKSKE